MFTNFITPAGRMRFYQSGPIAASAVRQTSNRSSIMRTLIGIARALCPSGRRCRSLIQNAPMSSPATATPAAAPLSQTTLWLLATIAGVSVANIYYNQPLLDDFRQSFPAHANLIGAVPTFTQLGYAAGMLFLAPLGDRFERRSIILWKLAGLIVALAAAALSPSLASLAVASLAIGVLSTIAQQAVPFAAELASPSRRGQAVGTVMSGLLLGILLARTAAGAIAQHFGWRVVFWAALTAMVVLSALIVARLPRSQPTSTLPYGKLLLSMWHLTREQPVLREASLTGAALFASFSAFWTILTLLLAQAPFHYGPQTTGLFGLVGAAGALVAPLAGKSSDRRGPRVVITGAIVLTALSFVIFWLSARHVAGLIVGVILLDIGVQAAMISNQSRIYALKPEARSRINTVYMVCYFIGASVGSALGSIAWRHFGWPGVCALGLLTTAVAAISHRRGRLGRVFA